MLLLTGLRLSKARFMPHLSAPVSLLSCLGGWAFRTQRAGSAYRSWASCPLAVLFRAALIITLFAIESWSVGTALAQSTGAAPTMLHENPNVAPVVIYGKTLFKVRGAQSYAAEDRAAAIVARIFEAARHNPDGSASVEVRTSEYGEAIFADTIEIMTVTATDAQHEGFPATIMARAFATRIAGAINEYRDGRSTVGVSRSLQFALGWTLAFGVFLSSLFLVRRLLRKHSEFRVRRWLAHLERKTSRVVDANALFAAHRLVLRGLTVLLITAASYSYIVMVLREFTYTKTVAILLIDTLAGPVISLCKSALAEIPDLITIVVIVLITQYFLNFIRLIFESIESGALRIKSFEIAWTWPTHRIVKSLVVICAVVVIYPFVPGSSTEAFKGMTVLLGLVVTIGANSVAANLLAGLIVVYKRGVNVGDLISVGEVLGRVERVDLLETQLRSVKNEMISLPNNMLLNSQVTNYTRTADTDGLIIHTTVGIGYDSPRHLVERLLIRAAQETAGIKTDPPAFVLRTALDSHDIKYELNAYRMEGYNPIVVRSDLNAKILDIFNSNGVQIMTPFYVGDPPRPKIPSEISTA